MKLYGSVRSIPPARWGRLSVGSVRLSSLGSRDGFFAGALPSSAISIPFNSCDGFFERFDLPVVERKLNIDRTEAGNSEGMRRNSGWRTGLGSISSVQPMD